MRYLAWGLAAALTACGGSEAPETANSEADRDGGNLMLADFEETAEAAVTELQSLSEEFAVVQMAARTQDAFRMNDGAIFTVQAYDHERELRVDERFDLEHTVATGSPVLAAHDTAGFAMQTFTLADSDRPRILAVRQTLANMKAAAPGENQLSLNAVVSGCLKDPANKPEDLKLSVFLKIRPDGDFFPFFSEQVLPSGGPGYAASFWTPCEEKRDS